MKRPVSPPKNVDDHVQAQDWFNVLHLIIEPRGDGGYLHWDELRHRKPPAGLTSEKWWFGLKMRRRLASLPLPCRDRDGQSFSYLLVDPIPRQLHEIDLGAGAWINASTPVIDSDMRDQYHARSVMEEAITSSQLEGAVTTRRVAKEMLRTGRRARNRSEQMILNNYEAMQKLRDLKDVALTPELVLEIHRWMTRDAMDDPSASGRFRRSDEHIVVQGDDGTVYHWPPSADELPARVQAMCEFANGGSAAEFVHPVLRAIVLHFWLAYDHPFVDGNGRTARALFYWCMLRHGYWLFEFLSISEVILKARVKYYMAFLHSETDDNDLTYFVLYHLDVLQRAIESLHAYIERKTREARDVETLMRGASGFNHRQRSLLAHALKHPGFRYTIDGHRESQGVVYETARTDLLSLAKRGLLRRVRLGKTWFFEAEPGLESRLATGRLRRHKN
jgi:Fic family protein